MPADEPRQIRIGELILHDRFDGRDFWLAKEYAKFDGEASSVDTTADEKPKWLRWPLNADYEQVALKPIFPDRPVVVETEIPLCLTPGTATRIYARCPAWARVELLGKGDPLSIEELPSVMLSNTWFGAFTEGALGYWVSSRARTRIEPDPAQPWMAICPIHIHNTSEIELTIERICLRVEHLSLFASAGQLWADETQVSYRGVDKVSRIQNTGVAPQDAGNAILATPPREPMGNGITAKTFASLKALSSGGAF